MKPSFSYGFPMVFFMVITPSSVVFFGRSEAFNQRCLELPAASIAPRHREGLAVESLHGQLQEDQGHAMDAMGTDGNLGKWPCNRKRFIGGT